MVLLMVRVFPPWSAPGIRIRPHERAIARLREEDNTARRTVSRIDHRRGRPRLHSPRSRIRCRRRSALFRGHLGISARQPDLAIRDERVNSRPGLVATGSGSVLAIISLTLEGGRIYRIQDGQKP